MPATIFPPTVSARKAVERALAQLDVGICRESASSAMHRVEYELAGRTLAAVGWTDELSFVAHPSPDIVALIRAHHALDATTP